MKRYGYKFYNNLSVTPCRFIIPRSFSFFIGILLSVIVHKAFLFIGMFLFVIFWLFEFIFPETIIYDNLIGNKRKQLLNEARQNFTAAKYEEAIECFIEAEKYGRLSKVNKKAKSIAQRTLARKNSASNMKNKTEKEKK